MQRFLPDLIEDQTRPRIIFASVKILKNRICPVFLALTQLRTCLPGETDKVPASSAMVGFLVLKSPLCAPQIA